MTYSCSDFQQDVSNLMLDLDIIKGVTLPDDVEETTKLVQSGIRHTHIQAERGRLATLFYDEVLASTETFAGIEESHGAPVQGDVFYLFGAILRGGHIELEPHERESARFFRSLPSGEKWMEYVQLTDA
ncbi:hypothetical protein [Paraburkholderia sp. BCC1886]|uniref:hypothetical protein n=1 Tax=Paraburkholderia sp. BCC1886 TaxID=2562670 RepID=UPI001183926A|nr:hypothetical protein [Paraburkholderia sp. BCC1886]